MSSYNQGRFPHANTRLANLRYHRCSPVLCRDAYSVFHSRRHIWEMLLSVLIKVIFTLMNWLNSQATYE
jgi:hypothetical protein